MIDEKVETRIAKPKDLTAGRESRNADRETGKTERKGKGNAKVGTRSRKNWSLNAEGEAAGFAKR